MASSSARSTIKGNRLFIRHLRDSIGLFFITPWKNLIACWCGSIFRWRVNSIFLNVLFWYVVFEWPIGSSGSRRPNAAREQSRVQSLRDGIDLIFYHFHQLNLRSDKALPIVLPRSIFWCLYCQLSNLCSRHCRPCHRVPSSPSWTSCWWPTRTSPISVVWSKRTEITTNNKRICIRIIR